MKRTSLFFTAFVVAILLLTACGGQETSTSVPGTNVPQMTSTSDMATAGANQTGTAGIPVTGENSPYRLSNLMDDYEVRNGNGDQIGEVNDMVLDFDQANIPYVVVGTGGFLGLGENNVLIPWNLLQLQTGEQNVFVFSGNEDAYKNFPDTNLSTMLPGKGQPAENWDATLQSYWQNGGKGNANGLATNTPENGSNMTAAPQATTAQGVQKAQGVLLASDLLKATVEVNDGGGTNNGVSQGNGSSNPSATQTAANGAGTTAAPATSATSVDLGTGNSLGTMDLKVDDVIVDPNAGKVQYVVVTGAFTGGQRTVAVPLKYLQWDATNQKFILGVNQIALVQAPAFENGQYPDFLTNDWSDQLNTFWNNLQPNMLNATPVP